jgi:adenylyltransferase/sulfurtransferase
MIGTIQANEAIKLILGVGEPLIGRLLLLDALRMRFREVRLPRDADCPVCGDHPTIHDLQDYEAFCGMPHTAGAAQGARDESPGFDISPVELKRALDGGAAPLLLDVREPMEYRINRLPGAVLVPLAQLPDALSQLDQTRDYVVYCHHGIRSVRAVEFLRAAGLRARNLAGGITAWIEQVEPGMLRY